MKKMMSLLLSGMMVLSLAACSGSETAKETTKEEPKTEAKETAAKESEAATTEAKKEPVTLKIGCVAATEPCVQIMKEAMEGTGYEVEVVVFDGNNLPAEALNAGDIDGLFCNSLKWMNTFNEENNADLAMAFPYYFSYAGLYSAKWDSPEAFPDGAKVIVSNGLSNIDGGLRILQNAGLITLAETPSENNFYSIIDIVEKTAKKAKVDKWKDQYVMPLHVTSDSKYLFFERTKRTWDEVDVCSVNLSTLEVKEIIHEEDKPYRDPHARNVAILNDGKDILFRSERTGWGHYYHYDGDGNLKNVMTSGEWVTGYINSIDTLKRKVYLYGYGKDKKVNPFYYMLFEVDIDKEGVTPLSTEDGQHNVNFLKSHNYYIDTYSRVDMEPKIMLKDRKGKVIMELAKPDLDLVYASGWKKPERFVVKAADNITDLYGVMRKPSDFNPEKKYPIISVVYPGPYFGFVPTNFTLDDSYCTRMAQLGFIVITVGHRGDTPMRGKAYHRYGYGNMRDYPLADDKYAIEQLAQRHSFINGKKVGIYGHSGGGFMAAAAIFTYPDFYTAAVSCSGNHDNSIYNRGWGECYNGVKEVEKVVKDSLGNETKEYEYKFSVKSNAEIAKNLKGHLMLVTGDMDKNVNPAHTYRVAQALIEAGKDFDMLVIPGAGHGYGSADKYFEKKMYRFFAKHLLGDNRADYWGDINCTK